MGFNLKARKEKTKKITIPGVEGDGEPLEVTYKVHAITPTVQAEIANLQQDDFSSASKWLEVVLAGWNVTNDGDPVPLTEATFKTLDFELLNAILKAVGSEINPAAPTDADPNAPKA